MVRRLARTFSRDPENRSISMMVVKVGKVICLMLFLALTLTACRQPPLSEEIPSPVVEAGETATVESQATDPVPDPTDTTIADPEPIAIPQAYPVDSTPTPITETVIGPQGTPTKLPEPHLIRILDWELIQDQSPALCAGCSAGRTVVPAPRQMGIVLIRVFSPGESIATITINTDLAYANPLICEVSEGEAYCGAIFGQVVDGKVTIVSEAEGGTDREVIYYLTFQKWADYLQ